MGAEDFIFKRDLASENAVKNEDRYSRYKNAIDALRFLEGNGLIKIECDDADVNYAMHCIYIEILYNENDNDVCFKGNDLNALINALSNAEEFTVGRMFNENYISITTIIYEERE